MRRLDCVLEPKKDDAYNIFHEYKGKFDPSPIIRKKIGLPFFNTSQYDLGRIKSDPSNVLINFHNYVQGFSANVQDILSNFKIEPIIKKLDKNNCLYMMIDKFTEIDLHPSVIDNHQMGTVYEELLRRFYEAANEIAGDHYTPRDIVKLLACLLFEGNREDLEGQGKIRSIYDPCCGTGGMLTIGKNWILENINPDLRVELYGQTLLDESFAVCKSDFLLLGENPENIYGPDSSISEDRLKGRKFDYMITNPPFGISWKREKEREFVYEEAKDPNGRFFAGTPRTSDGAFLFLQHLIHKMSPKGSRIGIIFNGSPLFTGDAGSGESEIRKWIIENDWLECIVSLPDRMFFNTGITTYIWIVTNKKTQRRKGSVQLIDGSSFYTLMKKNLGDKGKYITEDHIQQLLKIYLDNEESDFCKIYPNNFFGYTKVIIEQPLIEGGKIKTDRHGNHKPDISKRDHERVPLSKNVEEYYEKEVMPYAPKSWMDRSKDKVGYKINFTKYFYKFKPLRNLKYISKDLKSLNIELRDNISEQNNQMPKHWELKKLKYLVLCNTDTLPNNTAHDHRFYYIQIGDVDYVEGITINKEISFSESPPSARRIVKPKDVIISTVRTYLRAISIVPDIDNMICSTAFCVLRSRPELIDYQFLFYSVASEYFISKVISSSHGIAYPVIRPAELLEIKIPLPPLKEQRNIVKLLSFKMNHHRNMILSQQKRIELLKEYRKSLISSAVTGKIKVTEDML